MIILEMLMFGCSVIMSCLLYEWSKVELLGFAEQTRRITYKPGFGSGDDDEGYRMLVSDTSLESVDDECPSRQVLSGRPACLRKASGSPAAKHVGMQVKWISPPRICGVRIEEDATARSSRRHVAL